MESTITAGPCIEQQKNGHIVLRTKNKNGIPLFLIPGTGGKVTMYKTLGRALNDTFTLYGIEMMGALAGEKPFNNIPDIANQNIRWIRSVQKEGPYCLIGHSFGAYVSFEMARQLEDAGEALQFVAILDQPIKPVNGFEGEFNRAQIADYVLHLVADYFQGYKILMPPYPDWIYELRSKLEQYAPEDMVPYISKFVSEKIPQKSRSIKYFSRLVNIRFCNESMVYRPYGKIRTALVLLRAIKSEWDHPDEDLGWSLYADDVRINYVTGNHLNMIWGANALAVAKHLTQRIV